MRYGNGAADNMLSVFQITNEENACLSLKKQVSNCPRLQNETL